jgi:hypothetical protein
MKPLGEEAKKYCRAGHLLERPFLKQFHQHSIDGRAPGYKSVAIHETPVGTSINRFESNKFVNRSLLTLFNYLSLTFYNSI